MDENIENLERLYAPEEGEPAAVQPNSQNGEHVQNDMNAQNSSENNGKEQPQNKEEQEAPVTTEMNSLAEKYLDIARKTKAEFDNYRKRIAKERELWQREVLSNFLKEFLPALDDLDIAIAASEKESDKKTTCEGIRLVRKNIQKALEKAGVEEIEAIGKTFDPNWHEAISVIQAPQNIEPNTVIEVFRPGFKIGEFVVRASQVIVAQ